MDTPETETSEFANRVYENMMSLFYQPEIERRKEQNLLPKDFVLLAAQALFYADGQPPKIRLNEEVSVEIKLRKGANSKTKDFWPTIDEVEGIKLNEKEYLNCGHSTLILLKDGFQLTFDFHYNKHISQQYLDTAKEFLLSSKHALAQGLTSAFIDTSFSTIELLAKTNLFREATLSAEGHTNHNAIKAAFNLRFKNSQTDFELEKRRVFNQLSDARRQARYLEGKLSMNQDELESIYRTLEKMYIELCDRAGAKLPESL